MIVDLVLPGLADLLEVFGICAGCVLEGECATHETFRCRRCGSLVLWEHELCPACFPDDAAKVTRWGWTDGFPRMELS